MRGREWILVEKIGMEQSSWPLLSLSLERMSVIVPSKARAQEVECIELLVDVGASELGAAVGITCTIPLKRVGFEGLGLGLAMSASTNASQFSCAL